MLETLLNSLIYHCSTVIDQSQGMFLALFIAGLVGGVTHCMAMCGPFVITQAGQINKIRDVMLIPYHLGRLTTYSIMGAIMFSLVNVLAFFSPVRLWIIAPLLLLAGLVFLANGVPSLFKLFPWVGKIRLPISIKLIGWMQSKIVKSQGVVSRYILGLILGLMPCGLVVAALMVASTAQTLVAAMLAMAVFGAGTIPALMVVMFGKHKIEQKCPSKVAVIRSVFLVWSGLWLFGTVGIMVLKG